MGSILRVRDKDGTVIDIPAIVGPRGPQGPQGPAGAGSGDMLAAIYDPNGRAKDIFAEIDGLKTSVSEGKALVAAAVTDKGIETAADATFQVIAESIGAIVTLDAGSADADSAAEHILAGKTAYVKGKKITGGMENQGAKTVSLNCGESFNIPAGYHNGAGKATANSLASQTEADATDVHMLSGKTAWVNGKKVTGTIESRGAQTITPGTEDKVIPAGVYLSGEQIIKGDANLKPENIVSGVSIFGVAGSSAPFMLDYVGEGYTTRNTTVSAGGGAESMLVSAYWTGVDLEMGDLLIYPDDPRIVASVCLVGSSLQIIFRNPTDSAWGNLNKTMRVYRYSG